MEYKYSNLIDPSTYDTLGLCESLPLREPKNAHVADVGCLRAQADWRKYVGKVENFTGCMSPRFNALAVAIPESLPERLEITAYANEFAFLHDDVTDSGSQSKSDEVNDEVMHGFQTITQAKTLQSSSGRSQIQAKLMLELMSIDRERAITLMKCWEKLVGEASGRQRTFHFNTLEDYIPYRLVDVGQTFWYGLITFAMGITIPEHELELAKETSRPAFITLGLANDFFSWQKEYDDFMKTGVSEALANAIWILMQEHSVGVEEAKELCKDHIRNSCREYLRVKQEVESTRQVSVDLRKYLAALELSISANVIWSQYSARYNFRDDSQIHKSPKNANPHQSVKLRNGERKTGSTRTTSSYICESCKDHTAVEPKENVDDCDIFSSFPNSEADKELSLGINRVNGANGINRINGINGANGANGTNGVNKVNGVKGANGANGTNGVKGITGVNSSNGVNGISGANGANGVSGINGVKEINLANETSSDATSIADPHLGLKDVLLNRNLPRLEDNVVLAPVEYLTSLPSKGVRNAAIDALNVWLKVPVESLNIIKSVVSLLHSSSLMLDDMEDSSPLRRGRPSTHVVFGFAQTINSADFLFVEALDKVRELNDPKCINIFADELRNLYIGQSYDLFWTHNVACPTVEEYLRMVDNKTGGLFRLLSQLMIAKSTNARTNTISGLITLIGRHFQIRDDYQNLVSADYTNQKGFCEDLDEGKFSLPLIHALQSDAHNMQLRSILQERRAAGKLTFELKQIVLEHLNRTQSLEYTKTAILALQAEIDGEIDRVEKELGAENFILRLLLDRLRL